jgi:hypothetical protein
MLASRLERDLSRLFVWTVGASFGLRGYAQQGRMDCFLIWRALETAGTSTLLSRYEMVIRSLCEALVLAQD